MAASSVDPRNRSNGSLTDRRSSRIPILVSIAVISLIGAGLFLSSSPHGVHASPDSFTYLGAAASLTRGRGWTYAFGETGDPVTLFPPLYSLLLAVPDLLGITPFTWVLWQNAVLLGALSFLVGLAVLDATDGSPVAAVIAVLLVALGTPTTIVYANIWSETLFYPLVVVILAALARSLGGGRTRWLVLAAGATSVGMLTRYAGLSVFATACLLLLGWPRWAIRDRVRRLALFAAVALPLNAIWVLRNLSASGTLTGNNQLVHGLSDEEVLDGFRTIGSWFVPSGSEDRAVFLVPLVASVVLLILLVAWAVIRTDRPERRKEPLLPPIVAVCLAYAVVHFAFIVVTNAFSTRSPPFNDRILGSTFAPIVIAIVVAGHVLWRAFPRRRPLHAVALLVGACLLALSIGAAPSTMATQYSSERGTLPELRATARSLSGLIDADSALLSNRANIAWFLTGRAVESLPRSCAGGQVLPNPTYDPELRALAQRLGDAPRQVIFFRRSPKCEPFSMDGLKTTLRVQDVGPDAPVFVLDGPTAHPG